MAEFTEYLQRLRTSQPFIEMDMNIHMLKQLPELNPSILENFSVNDFLVDSFLAHHQQPPEFPASYDHNGLSSTFHHPDILNSATIVHAVASTSSQNLFPDNCKKRKAEAQSTSSSKNISPTASTTNTKKKNKLGRGKKGKNKEKEVDEAEEVIHVRAKRGQATDSHSIAERSMGIAVMLDEIINYVHSLQNQVEFLSMELAAASCSYDLNLETETSKKAQAHSFADNPYYWKLIENMVVPSIINGAITALYFILWGKGLKSCGPLRAILAEYSGAVLGVLSATLYGRRSHLWKRWVGSLQCGQLSTSYLKDTVDTEDHTEEVLSMTAMTIPILAGILSALRRVIARRVSLKNQLKRRLHAITITAATCFLFPVAMWDFIIGSTSDSSIELPFSAWAFLSTILFGVILIFYRRQHCRGEVTFLDSYLYADLGFWFTNDGILFDE
ncbi:hypothetical protein GH714_013358 [Hevea brasiliensis]|uniref:BHLH domain-containing protein n=1 Tax=Hevea brasiliensis TaxID=3981 RepID=A0A6A6MJ57_HEVBR|nr:hypothetical protein GH714_013358 [Hevea brasiliensis]